MGPESICRVFPLGPLLPLLTISSEMIHHLSDLERGRLANPHLFLGLGIGVAGVVDRLACHGGAVHSWSEEQQT